jgi:hypothetical protein
MRGVYVNVCVGSEIRLHVVSCVGSTESTVDGGRVDGLYREDRGERTDRKANTVDCRC